jgi:invasion protein IalB
MNQLIIAVTVVVALASAALAQAGLPGGARSLTESHGDWVVVCSTRPESTPLCSISQQQRSRQTGQRVLAIELRPVGSGVEGAMSLPLGLDLESGVRLRIDDAGEAPLRFKTCRASGCIVELRFDGAALDALRAGSALNVLTLSTEREELPWAFSLAGFSAALARAAELAGG